jgi:hypothetical protein
VAPALTHPRLGARRPQEHVGCYQWCYHRHMATTSPEQQRRTRRTASTAPDRTRKRSVTLTGELIDEVEDLAGEGGFSAATAEALAHWVARRKLRRAIEAYEAENGEISEAEMDAAIAKIGGL